MSTEKMNTWLTLLANVGVLVGIVFLALEIQQNTDIVKAQTRDNISQKQVEWLRDIGTDPLAMELIRRGNSGNLEPDEVLSYSFISQSNLRMWENEYYQYKMGLFDESEFQPRIERWKAIMPQSPGRKQVWGTVRTGYSTEFRGLIDRLYEEMEVEGDT